MPSLLSPVGNTYAYNASPQQSGGLSGSLQGFGGMSGWQEAGPVQGNSPVNNNGSADSNGGVNGVKGRFDKNDCQTCKNRRYQDGSDDSGVSFKTPTKISPQSVASAVRGHEQEHVTRNRSKADRENKKIVSQTVSIHNAICPECGKVYVSGGTTRTVTRGAGQENKFNVGGESGGDQAGRVLDKVV